MMFRLCANDDTCLGSFVIFQGIRTSIVKNKKPYIIVIFPPVPPLDPCMVVDLADCRMKK